MRDTPQISRGKFDRLHRTPAGSTTAVLDGWDFAVSSPLVRPQQPRYPVLVHQVAALLHASFRPRLAATPLHFANPSPHRLDRGLSPPSCRTCSAHWMPEPSSGMTDFKR